MTQVEVAFNAGADIAFKIVKTKLATLIKEWSHSDSSEGKYRLEAYKELLEFIEQ